MTWNRRSRILLIGLAALATSAAARGDIIVSIESRVVAPGAPVAIDVTFSSSAPGEDFLDAYSLEFAIAKVGGVPSTGLLYFDASRYTAARAGNDPPTSNAPNVPIAPYIYGPTADTQAVTFANPLDPAPLSLGASDSADNAGIIAPEIPGSPGIGLIRLMLTTDGLLATRPGDVFEISLVAANSAFIDFTKDSATIDFTSNVGTIAIAAVPEPGALALMVTGLVAVAGLRYGRRK